MTGLLYGEHLRENGNRFTRYKQHHIFAHHCVLRKHIPASRVVIAGILDSSTARFKEQYTLKRGAS
jgi:hypothetical protein